MTEEVKTEKTEAPELTVQEKLQIEYNSTVSQYGHNLMLIETLREDMKQQIFDLEQKNIDIADKLKKILRRAKTLNRITGKEEELKNAG